MGQTSEANLQLFGFDPATGLKIREEIRFRREGGANQTLRPLD